MGHLEGIHTNTQVSLSKKLFLHRAGSDVAEGVAAVLKLILCAALLWTAHSTVWAGVAQLVEHLICNQRVGGSNPSVSSKSASSARPAPFHSGEARLKGDDGRKMHRWPSG